MNVYKWIVIGISAVHVVSFGYMIFGVEWLGWDIIEPLTFSVATLYMLIALRFYRKFYKDRNQLSLKDRFRQFALKPQNRMNLSMLQNNLQKQTASLEDIQLKMAISHNRLTPTTTYLNKFK